MTTTDDAPSEKRQHIVGFVFGVLLVLLPVVTKLLLRPSLEVDFVGGRYGLLVIGLFVGVSFGHHVGLAISVERTANRYAAIGAFLAISALYLSLAYVAPGVVETTGVIRRFGPVVVLVLSTLLLISGHYSGVTAQNEEVEKIIERFAESVSPLLLLFIWLMEALIPPILEPTLPAVGFEFGEATMTGLSMVTAIVVLSISWKVFERMSTPLIARQ